MGGSAPQVSLSPPRDRKVARSASHAARQDKAKSAKIKAEREDSASVPAGPGVLTIQKLKGDIPPCETPSSYAIDHENRIVFFNTYNEVLKYGSEIYACDLKTNTWKNVTQGIQYLPGLPFGAPERARQLPSRYGGSMAFYKDKITGQRLLLLFGGQVNGTEKDDLGDVSSELLAIDVDRFRWWVVDIAGGPIAARVDSHLIVVDDQLFIFGGNTYENGQFKSTESYNIARYANNRWTWQVRDVPYPPHVPALGFCCDAVAIQDVESPKILLTVGCRDINNTESLELVARSFVLFDIGSTSFTTQLTDNGDFPGVVSWYGMYNVPGALKADPASTSALICTFHTDSDPHPELYIYSLPPQGGCKKLGLRQRIAATKKTFELFAVVGRKMYLFGWTKDKWDILAEIPQHWISA
ncbi:hypothetical protein DFH06DRAFT_641778 [Mycena polygramma]|nr:hypothetical protein DFH06DRAFT_641778 [Mycena polygramma]